MSWSVKATPQTAIVWRTVFMSSLAGQDHAFAFRTQKCFLSAWISQSELKGIIIYFLIYIYQKLTVLDCSVFKDVGKNAYVLVSEDNTIKYNCMENCVYEMQSWPGSRFCFQDTKIISKCLEDNGKYLVNLVQ